jgi:nucleoside 2-deoxyribosyltransferase
MLLTMTAENETDERETPKSIFVISPIGKLDKDNVDFTKIFLEQIVKPAAAMAGGFKTPVRGDEVKAPGSITAKIVKDIVGADVCVADLTTRNPNVMYEVAIAHAAGKPVILLQQENEPPPFDFTGERAIHYSLRADEANEARDDLAEYLKHAFDEQLDEMLAKTMHPVRIVFRDLMTQALATKPEQAILARLDELGANMANLPSSLGLSRGWTPSSGAHADRLREIEPVSASPYSDSVVPTLRLIGQIIEDLERGRVGGEMELRALKDALREDRLDEDDDARARLNDLERYFDALRELPRGPKTEHLRMQVLNRIRRWAETIPPF